MTLTRVALPLALALALTRLASQWQLALSPCFQATAASQAQHCRACLWQEKATLACRAWLVNPAMGPTSRKRCTRRSCSSSSLPSLAATKVSAWKAKRSSWLIVRP